MFMKPEYYNEEFRKAVKEISDELDVRMKDIKIEKYKQGAGKFNYSAHGESSKYYFDLDIDNTFYENKIRVLIYIGDSSKRGCNTFSFADTITGAKTIARVVGGGLHRFNINWNPFSMVMEFGEIPIYIISTRDSYVKAPLEAILSGLPLSADDELVVYRLRHAEESVDWYRYYSYVFKIRTSNWYFLAAFPWLGSIDSGSFDSILFTDMQIEKVRKRGGKVTIKNLDVEYSDLQLFLLMHSSSFLENLIPELEVNQFRIPSFDSFGGDFETGWTKFLDKFYRRELRDCLGDIRSLVQDAMEIACKEVGIDTSKINDPDSNKLIGLLIGKGLLDGRFQEWTRAFTSFSNIGGHSKIKPNEDELRDKTLRKRLVLTILIGIHLVEEIDMAVFPPITDKV